MSEPTWSDKVIAAAGSLWALLTSAVRLLDGCKCEHLSIQRAAFLKAARGVLDRCD